MYKRFFKTAIDLSGAFAGIVLLSPLFVFLTVFLFFAFSGKPFFTQRRPGKNGKIFLLLKYKTMTDKRDSRGELLPDCRRLTRTGRFLRKTSLDELPQLINILAGQMSFIGPRPLLEEYLPLYNPIQARRHEVRPGITGWAQVNGRNSISWPEKFAHDVWYVDHISFTLDVQILFRTIGKVFRSEGVNASKDLSMEKFTGN